MKTVSTISLALVGVFLFNSCREELTSIHHQEDNAVQISAASVKDGRLYFTNKESLAYAYDQVKNADDDQIANYIDAKDIISLRPVVTEKNENLIAKKVARRVELLKQNKRYMDYLSRKGSVSKLANEDEIADDIDDLEEIIGDDAYGAFLDSRAEIQVADKIYKYTDVGLFIVKDSRYNELTQYLAVHNISDDLMYRTDAVVQQEYIQSKPAGIETSIGEELSYYNNFMIAPDEGGGGGGGSYNPPYNPPPVDPNIQIQNYINSLPNCSTYTTVLQNLFGDSDSCVNLYEERRRVKTKAYNYDYLLVYNLGVKVKHQYKGWTGLWRKEKADEIRLGVIYSEFLYDYSNHFQFSPAQYNITTIYNNNSRYMFDATTHWSQNGLQITGYSIQNFPKIIKDDIVVEQFGGKGIYGQAVNAAIAAGNKQLTSAKLSEYFWKTLIPELGTWWTNMGKVKPEANNTTLIYKTPPTIPGQLYIVKTFYDSAVNSEDVSKTFDWGFQIGFNVDPSTGNITPNTSTSALKKPKNFKVTMYGIAKTNGKWHGSKVNTANK